MTNQYFQLSSGSNLSQLEQNDDGQDQAIRSFERGPDEPTIKPHGLLWNCTSSSVLTSLGLSGVTEAMLRWNTVAGAWKVLGILATSGGDVRWLDAAGKTPMTGALAMGGQKITGLAAATANGDATRFEQTVLVSGANAFTGDQSMGGHRLTNLGAPSASTDAIRIGDLPSYLCTHWYQSNYDTLGNSKPVKWVDESNEDGSFTEVGFVPRRLTLWISGEFRQQSDNALWGDIVADAIELDISRWNSINFIDGNDGDFFLIKTIDSPTTARKVFVYLKWKFAGAPTGYETPLGFYLKFMGGGSGFGTPFLKLGKPGSTTDAGVVQAQAFFGAGT